MEDLWRVQKSAVDMKDLASLAEYHRYLARFKSEEVDAHSRNLLYGDAHFGPASKADHKK